MDDRPRLTRSYQGAAMQPALLQGHLDTKRAGMRTAFHCALKYEAHEDHEPPDHTSQGIGVLIRASRAAGHHAPSFVMTASRRSAKQIIMSPPLYGAAPTPFRLRSSPGSQRHHW